MTADFDGFYEGRVVEAELEAIRLRKDDQNRVMFWLWPPFGPTDERERELTAPKPVSPLHHLYMAGLQNSSPMAYYQAAMMQNALANSAYDRQRQGYYANIFGLGQWL